MNPFLLALSTLVIGVLVTILVSRYYFQRTITKSLTPYIHNSSQVLSWIDPIVRGELKVSFREEEVKDLTLMEFIIANDGERSIRDCIEPLSVLLPKEAKLLDASILHKYPSELNVRIISEEQKDGSTKIQFPFPLLNRGDFFLTKLLVKGNLEAGDLVFHILVDDLPPTLKAKSIPIRTTSDENAKVDWSAIGVGMFMVAIGLASAYVLFRLWKLDPRSFPYPWSTYNFSVLPAIAMGVFVLSILVWFGVGIAFGIDEGFSGVLKRRQYFPLPEQYRRNLPFPFASLSTKRDKPKS